MRRPSTAAVVLGESGGAQQAGGQQRRDNGFQASHRFLPVVVFVGQEGCRAKPAKVNCSRLPPPKDGEGRRSDELVLRALALGEPGHRLLEDQGLEVRRVAECSANAASSLKTS